MTNRMRCRQAVAILALLLGMSSHAFAQVKEVVRIASLDMTSGPMAALGISALKGFQFSAQMVTTQELAGPVTLEIGPFDNKLSAQEALSLLRSIISQDIRYVVQGASSSAVGIALSEAIERHNARNPGQEIVYLNYASQAPEMTNEKCSYWHFRIDAHSDMKVDAMTTYLASLDEVRKVFLLNPNYAYGQEVSRMARSSLHSKRTDIAIVGDDFHPTGQVKDYAPYIAKIRQSGADTVITASFGADLALMIRAAKDYGLEAQFYTLNGNNTGVPSAVGTAGEGSIKLISAFSPNHPDLAQQPLFADFKQQFGEDFIGFQGHNAMLALAHAIRTSGSTAPAQVARQLSGMRFEGLNGPVDIRPQDHQALQPLFVLSWEKVDGQHVIHDQEGTGLGWKQIAVISADAATLPTTCAMKRPS